MQCLYPGNALFARFILCGTKELMLAYFVGYRRSADVSFLGHG